MRKFCAPASYLFLMHFAASAAHRLVDKHSMYKHMFRSGCKKVAHRRAVFWRSPTCLQQSRGDDCKRVSTAQNYPREVLSKTEEKNKKPKDTQYKNQGTHKPNTCHQGCKPHAKRKAKPSKFNQDRVKSQAQHKTPSFRIHAKHWQNPGQCLNETHAKAKASPMKTRDTRATHTQPACKSQATTDVQIIQTISKTNQNTATNTQQNIQ